MSDETTASLLIVEDSNTQAVHLIAVLEANGFDVDWAKNAQSAQNMMDENAYDMVLTDIEMPGISGYELCKEIKNNVRFRHIPVILLTSRKDPKNIILGLECGCDSFFTKPYDPIVIIKRIEQLLYNRQLRSSGKLKVGIELVLFGNVITINSEKEQILDLLISSFEEMIQTNTNLEESQLKLAEANRKIEDYIEILENRVRTSEERYRTIFDLLAEGIMICDNWGHVKNINSSSQRIFSCEDVDLSFRVVSDFIPQIETPLNVWMGEESYRYLQDVKCTRLDGEEIYINVSVSRIGNHSKADYACLVHDRTDAKKVEDRLRQTEKMEAIGQLTGGIAHDYNNQLTVIEGALEELKENLGHSEDDSKQLVELISSAAKAGAQLTRRLLTFSRAQPEDTKSIEVAKCLQSVKQLIRPLVGKNIRVNVEIKEEKIWHVKLDESQFENAIMNLCINARDAMLDGGEITIKIENCRIDDELVEQIGDIEEGNYVLISFSDTGTGIPLNIQDKIFEPFFTTKPVGKGTGMGLAMVYGFVKQAGGQMKLYSEHGVGTTFKIYLPKNEENTGSEEPSELVVKRTDKRLKILLVEDDALIRKLTEKQLNSLGHHVDCVESVRHAEYMLVNNQQYDVLIVDIAFDRAKSGMDILDQLPESSVAGIVITSGYFKSNVSNKDKFGKPITFLYKPYNREKLAMAIDKIVCEESC